MKKPKYSKQFLEEIKKVPIVQVACEKTGLSRNTVYRWKREDKEFAKAFDEALADGVNYVNDMSESQLLQLIKDRTSQQCVSGLLSATQHIKRRLK